MFEKYSQNKCTSCLSFTNGEAALLGSCLTCQVVSDFQPMVTLVGVVARGERIYGQFQVVRRGALNKRIVLNIFKFIHLCKRTCSK